MKRQIAIIAGGDSSEHEVSLRSAAGLYSFMDKERYDITIVVLKGKKWVIGKIENGAVLISDCEIDKNDFSYTCDGVKHTFDFAYITIHGTPGENGILQGYLDMIGLPYSCCGVLAAALTFNKYACNHYLSYFGFHIANSMRRTEMAERAQDSRHVRTALLHQIERRRFLFRLHKSQA